MRIQIALAIAAFLFLATTVNADELIEERLQVVGAITNPTEKDNSLGIVVLKDSKTKRTIAVEVGKPFIIDNKAFSVTAISGKKVIISDGVELYALTFHNSRFQHTATSKDEEEKQAEDQSLVTEFYSDQPEDDEELRSNILEGTDFRKREKDTSTVSFRKRRDLRLKRAQRLQKTPNFRPDTDEPEEGAEDDMEEDIEEQIDE